MARKPAEGTKRAPTRGGRVKRLMQKAWWLHSFFALSFGIGVMLFARQGLQYADKVLMVLGASWLLVFVAFRFIVGASNRGADDRVAKRGLRLITNYVIKQLYQQMFFFLVPLYASSATWSLASPNWWLVPVLLLCAVLSTMDLVFDNFIMEHRIIASAMYGFCMFGVLNLILPLVFRFHHFDALLMAAGATAPTVALLTFQMRAVFSLRGISLLLLMTGLLTGAAYYGRIVVPPAPMSMQAGAIGHGVPGQYECVPGPKRDMSVDQLGHLRCVSEVTEPGGMRDSLVHVWTLEGAELFRVAPAAVPACGGDVYRSEIRAIPEDPRGTWACTILTEDGQLVGETRVEVVAGESPDETGAETDAGAASADAASPADPADAGEAAKADAGAGDADDAGKTVEPVGDASVGATVDAGP